MRRRRTRAQAGGETHSTLPRHAAMQRSHNSAARSTPSGATMACRSTAQQRTRRPRFRPWPAAPGPGSPTRSSSPPRCCGDGRWDEGNRHAAQARESSGVSSQRCHAWGPRPALLQRRMRAAPGGAPQQQVDGLVKGLQHLVQHHLRCGSGERGGAAEGSGWWLRMSAPGASSAPAAAQPTSAATATGGGSGGQGAPRSRPGRPSQKT